MVEQIHEVLCTIVKLYSTSEITGVLSTALLYDIAKFLEALQKVFTFVKSQQGMGKIKQLFTQPGNAVKLETCKQELNHACQKFKVHLTGSTISQMVQMQKDAKQLHEELIALLAAHPDMTSSGLSSVAGTLSSMNDSSESFSMLPPSPKIFHGRDSELQDIIKILVQDSARVAVLGTGGIGKTSLATAALHDPQIEAKYSRRYFVPCHSSFTCTQLVSAVTDHLGVEKGSNLAQKIVHYLNQNPPSLLVLDNLETPWESISSQSEVEEFLSLLTDVAHLGLMITMRGAERPAKVKWTRLFLLPLDPLSTSAALQTFVDVADDTHHQDSVKQLLEVTGNLPLAVSLISSVASHKGCDKALSRWKSESTHMISDGYDQRSSLDISIMLSLTGSRMTVGAQDLLSLLSMLPGGLTDVELVQAELGIPDILGCKSILIRTSLAFVGKDQRLKVLVPIREHTLRIHPPRSSLHQEKPGKMIRACEQPKSLIITQKGGPLIIWDAGHIMRIS
ncbi:P-loop containing nucleoside triphosphate hydrolase protein [Mycena rebaudengoi]|nr:P-loop containing nucleoside triphosphate hydrolase protein [Mycena rebaudengoi]